MSGPDNTDNERAVVKAYVRRHQKRLWDHEADGLGMSQSEYVRSMIQAGRRELALAENGEQAEKPRSDDNTPGVNPIEKGVLQVLSVDDPQSWDTLLEKISDDLEERLEDALESLKEQGHIKQRARGEFVLSGGGDE